jgi:hypothetical protein
LPGGKYQYCIDVIPEIKDESGDQTCDEIEQQVLTMLNLVSPFDKDTIQNLTPILSWFHNEPFLRDDPGGTFRMIVTETVDNQTAEIALNSNPPVFVKDFLQEHQLFYPSSGATSLKPGKRYAWKVQKLSEGRVVAESESWIFITERPFVEVQIKYASLLMNPGNGFYEAVGRKIFYKFEDRYNTSGALSYSICDDNLKPLSLKTLTEGSNNSNSITAKLNGDNRYEMDLNAVPLKDGFYTLLVQDENKKTYYLKFHIGL